MVGDLDGLQILLDWVEYLVQLVNWVDWRFGWVGNWVGFYVGLSWRLGWVVKEI